jgi:acetyltransferase-like isoleucine patch superfamily enzyme
MAFTRTSLTCDEQQLLDTLRGLWRKLLVGKWNEYRRGDAFTANLFGRKEKARLLLGADAVIFDSTLVYGDVSIGEGTHVGQYVVLDGTGGLRIGRRCSVASGARIQTHDSAKWAVSRGKAAYEYASVEIKDYSYVGANATITSGITIGPCSVVGAGAVVTKDVPPNTIVAGVPAEVIGRVDVNGEAVTFHYERGRG